MLKSVSEYVQVPFRECYWWCDNAARHRGTRIRPTTVADVAVYCVSLSDQRLVSSTNKSFFFFFFLVLDGWMDGWTMGGLDRTAFQLPAWSSH
jgi:hypothetical protein